MITPMIHRNPLLERADQDRDPGEPSRTPRIALYGTRRARRPDHRQRPRSARTAPQVQQLFPVTDKTLVPHYHAWLRSGRIFTMTIREFNNRTVAHKWAATKRTNPRDRLVLACETCPPAMRSKRRPPRWGAIIRAAAARLGIKPGTLSAILDEEFQSAKPRWAGEETVNGSGCAEHRPAR